MEYLLEFPSSKDQNNKYLLLNHGHNIIVDIGFPMLLEVPEFFSWI